MNENGLDVEKLKKYWLLEAEEAYQVGEHLGKKNGYYYILSFFDHLVNAPL